MALSTDVLVERACEAAGQWYRALPRFDPRVNLGSVIGRREPALMSEQDCVVHFARFLHEAGAPWEAIHHQVFVSRWLFDDPHPAATAPAQLKRWAADLILIDPDEFLAATLPAKEPGFKFDAAFEFAHLSDFWQEPRAHPYGQPAKGRAKVTADVEKIGLYLSGGVCRSGYVIVFEACDHEFPPSYVAEAEERTGCRVRFVRGYE
jgi:hypothetical protein